MGAVRAFTPEGHYTTSDDGSLDVALNFSFWGYTTARVGNNGSVGFDPAVDQDLFYCYIEALDPAVPNSEWFGTPGMMYATRTNFVALFPWLTDNISPNADTTQLLCDIAYGHATIEGKQAFCVTWKDEPQYFVGEVINGVIDYLGPRNTYQCIIYEDDTFEFNYDSLSWSTPYDVWGGPLPDPFYWVDAMAGYRLVRADDLAANNDSAHDVVDEFAGSRAIKSHAYNSALISDIWAAQESAHLDGGALPLSTTSNVGVPGRWSSQAPFGSIKTSVDITLSATLTTDRPVVGGVIDVVLSSSGSAGSSLPVLQGSTDMDIGAAGRLLLGYYVMRIENLYDAPNGMAFRFVTSMDGYMGIPPVILPDPPEPAPLPDPEQPGVFPPPVWGGIVIRSLYGTVVDMNVPTITDGKPS